MNVLLNEHWEKFVKDSVSSGRYRSVSDVVLEGLRLVEEREGKIAALRHELRAAIAEGGDLSDESVDEALNKEAASLRRQGF
ncbi:MULTISPECIES: type II toxin-antitoxin system ParD family antitoxin [Rhizobium]|uniref:Type II toxin-antitoxin system ParD family antitoxin n=1 Tax=Rhizobium wuzhouense TaxID=1986026 RepID=A0ABX5NY09_9HYPH|nr:MULTISPECIES: type II toxin-antitoxin system ParD family antitoxin [Rhizobium]PYB77178.1 type II toxin-antitoxin system ParD family antitoxin [Rhizobium wuzhouense]RKE85811.1 antitoxin ParD1/3/4 [Rhizobium sp. AG855]